MTVVTRQTFHAAKDRFTAYKSNGLKGERAGAKVVDKLTRTTATRDGQQVDQWFYHGRLMFRCTTMEKQPGDVFPRTVYERF
jgi:hypothetical protein